MKFEKWKVCGKSNLRKKLTKPAEKPLVKMRVICHEDNPNTLNKKNAIEITVNRRAALDLLKTNLIGIMMAPDFSSIALVRLDIMDTETSAEKYCPYQFSEMGHNKDRGWLYKTTSTDLYKLIIQALENQKAFILGEWLTPKFEDGVLYIESIDLSVHLGEDV